MSVRIRLTQYIELFPDGNIKVLTQHTEILGAAVETLKGIARSKEAAAQFIEAAQPSIGVLPAQPILPLIPERSPLTNGEQLALAGLLQDEQSDEESISVTQTVQVKHQRAHRRLIQLGATEADIRAWARKHGMERIAGIVDYFDRENIRPNNLHALMAKFFQNGGVK